MQNSNINIDENYIRNIFIQNIERIKWEARKRFLPPPDESISEISEKEIVIPENSFCAGQPGPFKNEDLPYAAGIMDACLNPDTHEVSVMGSSQIAKTTIFLMIIYYFTVYMPSKIAYMLPIADDIKDYVKDKYNEFVKHNKKMKKLVRTLKEEGGREATKWKSFPGGRIRFFHGGSSSGTRGRTDKITFGDDIDQLKYGQQDEGDPVMRLRQRSKTHKQRKMFWASTPTRTGTSRIARLNETGSMEKWFVTCPHCEVDFYFKHENLDWEKTYEEDLFTKDLPDDKKKVKKHYPETAFYACENCGGIITENDRMKIIKKGYWKAENPEEVYHRSFWISQFSTPLSTFADIAREIVDAGDDPEKNESLYNTVFGLPYLAGAGEKKDPEALKQRVENYIDLANKFVVPNEIYFGVVTVDVQKDRIEVLVTGFGYKMETWVLMYQPVYGDTLDQNIYKKADEIFFADWRRADGTKLQMVREWMDSGYRQQFVARHTRGKFHQGICAIRGKGSYNTPILPRKFEEIGKGNYRTRCLPIGSNKTKELLFSMLDVKHAGPNYIHFCSAYCNDNFFKQLTSEVEVQKRVGNIYYTVYEKVHHQDRNEVLDLMYYAIAAALDYVGGNNWERLKKKYELRFTSYELKSELKAEEEVKEVMSDKVTSNEVAKSKSAVVVGRRRVHARNRRR